MPALSPTMAEGKIQSWTAKEGQLVNAGDVYCEVETDKASVAYEAVEEGWLAKIIIHDPEQVVQVGDAIGVMVDEEKDIAAFKDYVVSGGAKPKPTPDKTPEPVAATPAVQESREPSISFRHGKRESESPGSTGGRIFVSPYARRLASESSLNLADIIGTGPKGRIIAADVEKAMKQQPVKPSISQPSSPIQSGAVPYISFFPIPPRPEEGSYEDIPLTSMRKVIAERLSQSN
eukprot:UN25783